MTDPAEVTQLLQAYAQGDREAFDRVVPLVYPELLRIARRHIKRTGRGHTLDTGALVHEAYMKLAVQHSLEARDRSHFLAIAACAIRQVIIDFARSRAALKRGAGNVAVTLDEGHIAIADQAEWLLDIERILDRIRTHDAKLAQTFELRFFAGATEEETAEALGLPLRTVQRNWMRVRAWIRKELSSPDSKVS
jgi:RNA polymerase sigma factor (TIGR02999 family)